jgi:hypothetical protein
MKYLFIMLCALLPALSLGQDSSDATELTLNEKCIKRIAEEVKTEISNAYIGKMKILVERYEDFFELAPDKVQKLEVLSKGIVEEHVKVYTHELVEERWNSVSRVVLGTTFFINGRKCVVEGEEEDELFAEIKIGIVGEVLIMSINSQESSAAMMMNVDIKFEPTKHPKWLKAIAPLEQGDLDRFEDHLDKLERDRILGVVLAAIKIDLRLSDDQLEPMQEWLESSVSSQTKGSVHSAAMKVIGELPDELPEEMTQAQKEIWPFIKARLSTR